MTPNKTTAAFRRRINDLCKKGEEGERQALAAIHIVATSAIGSLVKDGPALDRAGAFREVSKALGVGDHVAASWWSREIFESLDDILLTYMDSMAFSFFWYSHMERGLADAHLILHEVGGAVNSLSGERIAVARDICSLALKTKRIVDGFHTSLETERVVGKVMREMATSGKGPDEVTEKELEQAVLDVLMTDSGPGVS